MAKALANLFPEVESFILPVEFKNSFEILKKQVAVTKPDYLIMLGQASGRARVCLEKIGLNWVQTQRRDEAGVQPADGKIFSDSSLALMSDFPIDQMYFELRKQNLPVEISFSAGAYVCNDLYFRALKEFTDLKSVFVHVPLLPEQLDENDERPSLDFEKQLDILKLLIHSSITSL